MNSKKNVRTLLKIRHMQPAIDWRLLFTLILFAGICACASTLPPPQWVFERDAIRLHLNADAQLNLRNEVPHTLLLCVYQLRDPIAFDRLAADTAGLYKLLECELFDGSVATSNRLIINPGQDQNQLFDRAAGVKYVAIVAGYYTIEKNRIVRLFDIPVVIEKTGLLFGKKKQKPGIIDIHLTLGPKQILAAKGN